MISLGTGGGYRVKETFLRYYRNIVFSIKIKGDKTTPGADLGDNDFVGKPEIVSCEAIVYTKDGDGWIGAKIEKKIILNKIGKELIYTLLHGSFV